MENYKIYAVGLALLAICTSAQSATYGGGSGTSEDPYRICDPNQMNTIGANPGDWSKCFKLMADIDMSVYTGTQYNIIGNSTQFTGTFDGNRHIISNLTYTTTAAVNNVGVFGITSGTIQNLGVKNVSISSNGNYVGGLVGQNYSTLSGCYATGSVSGQDAVGSLVGMNYNGTITSCYADGSVSGRDGVGGLAGYLYGALTNSYATGPVNGRNGVGGLVGYIQSDINITGTVTTCYATGSVSKTGSYAGGLVGYNYSGLIDASFWDIQTSSTTDGVGNEDPDPAGAMGKTTAQMQMLSTFTSAGWNFAGNPPDWWLATNHYPRLALGPYGDGRGTADDPYQIWTPQQMNAIGTDPNDWNKHFMLMADVNMSIYTGTQYNIIGNNTKLFTGTFDGKGHIISNLTYTTTAAVNSVGLFGLISGATIQNIGLENVLLSTSGLGSYIGGLVGWNYMGQLTACYATGSVSGQNHAGGLVGWNSIGGKLTNCYATASVSGPLDVGGLAGVNSGTISNCYSNGPVSKRDLYTGGLVGHNSDNFGLIDASFWDIQTSGLTDGVGNQDPDPNGVTGKTTTEMKKLSTFTSEGWDFVNVWGIGNGQTYPYLKTLTGINPADINYSGKVDLGDFAILSANWLEGIGP
jgi:hypothetical protein